jgi:hypothetical protein
MNDQLAIIIGSLTIVGGVTVIGIIAMAIQDMAQKYYDRTR